MQKSKRQPCCGQHCGEVHVSSLRRPVRVAQRKARRDLDTQTPAFDSQPDFLVYSVGYVSRSFSLERRRKLLRCWNETVIHFD